ncbi:MAG: thermonuclease family protein [Chitinophagaceae bacterium]|nr:MAG: thermonuclease family protein [Chitinophagaceae bacterium]
MPILKILLLPLSLFLVFHSTQSCKGKAVDAVSVSPLTDTVRGRVIGIKDGDTFELLVDQKRLTIRLSDIDCPEKKQPFGTKARQFASDLCFGKNIIAVKKGRPDRYGRLIVELFAGDTCVNKELVSAGLAWHFKQYSRNPAYAGLEMAARNSKLGIWSQQNPTPPWEWRKPKK